VEYAFHGVMLNKVPEELYIYLLATSHNTAGTTNGAAELNIHKKSRDISFSVRCAVPLFAI
jgi:hypothetical protein